jgi:hypothetical protein
MFFLIPCAPPEWLEEEVEVVREVCDAPVLESPCIDDRRVIISRNAGRMVGSWCQQEVISSWAAPDSCSSGGGRRGLSPSLITATATAAGLVDRIEWSATTPPTEKKTNVYEVAHLRPR